MSLYIRRGRRGAYHGRAAFHSNKNSTSQEEPQVECNDNHENTEDSSLGKSRSNGHAPEHNTELLVGKRQSPKSKVRGGVRDTVQAEFCYKLVIVDREFRGLGYLPMV